MVIKRFIKSSKGRIWEIDFLRGIAVIMMIVFHFLYDLNYFLGYSFLLNAGFWLLFARITAGIFVFLVGVSLTLSYSRIKEKMWSIEITKKYVKRGVGIFIWGLLITVLTWLFLDGNGTIWFGVLHLIGISIILARPLLRFRLLNLLLGATIVIIGYAIGTVGSNNLWLLPLGVRTAAFYTLDYLPILPWFGVVLLGLFFGNLVYAKGKSRFKLSDKTSKNIRPCCFLGRHSLAIYLLHQPVLIGLIHLALMI
jgi:uncharacterized membrane protein